MSHSIEATLEIGRSTLEVDIEYNAHPGEPMVRYYADGSGYPGSPPEAELLDVYVTDWNDRRRGSSWIWAALDRIAFRAVEDDWKNFELRCLEAEDELRYESQEL